MRPVRSFYKQKILAAAGLVFLIGCATYNPATGRNELIFISTASEVSMGQDIHSELSREFKFSADEGKNIRLRKIGRKLAQVSDRQDYEYNFYLIEKKEFNAFTIPGGKIYMFSGLFDALKSDDEIAAVLAHEIGHCSARHTVKKFQAAMGYNIIGSILLSRVDPQGQMREILSQGSGAVMSLIFSSYGRQDEYESDRLGIKYMHLAGYRKEAMVATFEALEKESKGDAVPLILRSHPFIKDRIVKVKEEIKKYQ